MIKKISAYTFILLANMILLAHAVIPHHHHQSRLCLISDHCAGDALPSGQHQSEPNHQHDSDTHSNPCILSDIVLVPPENSANDLCHCQLSTDNLSPDFQFILLSTDPGITAPIRWVDLFAPQSVPLYASIVNTALGLRAPPLV